MTKPKQEHSPEYADERESKEKLMRIAETWGKQEGIKIGKAEEREIQEVEQEVCRLRGAKAEQERILRRLKYRQTKVTNLWIATKLKEYEYAKMVLEEEIRIIEDRT